MTLAQTGIGTTTPNASAKLDVYSTNKGFLPPRVTLTSVTDATTIASPAEGLLVYNLGSVGLQAGYYYWNGANWATIATATSAGNGVTSMDMVKLYGEAHSSATGKISSSIGYVFTVPVSGRYLFDFTSTGTFLSGGMTIYYFQVRQGTTVLGSDTQTSYNNNVHVEYNGKVEVNLQAGVSYNVYNYTTGGSFESNDFDRVYYKLVAGNLPVTGQTVDYAMASLSANQSISAASNILFNTIQGAGITLNNGGFNLIANKTYKLEGAVGGSSTGYIYYAWVDATNTVLSGGSVGSVMKAGAAYTDGPQDKAVAYYTPTTNTTVYLRVLSVSGTSVAYPAAASPTYSSTWASINQIGSSAMINPWILSGTSTSNTTGNVGIGNNSPTQALDVTGNVKTSGNYMYTDGSSTAKKASGYFNSDSYLLLDNIKVACTRTGAGGGYAGLSLGAVTTTFNASISASYALSGSVIGGSSSYNGAYTTTASGSLFGWGFGAAGDGCTYLINDLTNSRVYRVILLIGYGFNTNFLSIERLN